MTGEILNALVQRIDMAAEEAHVLEFQSLMPEPAPAVVVIPKFLWDMILDTRREVT